MAPEKLCNASLWCSRLICTHAKHNLTDHDPFAQTKLKLCVWKRTRSFGVTWSLLQKACFNFQKLSSESLTQTRRSDGRTFHENLSTRPWSSVPEKHLTFVSDASKILRGFGAGTCETVSETFTLLSLGEERKLNESAPVVCAERDVDPGVFA